jgi:glutathione S-transferase
MITLYHAPRSRSSRIIWLLEELGADYRIELVPIIRGDGTGAPAPDSYLAIHPLRKVPAIKIFDEIVYESGAICLYLTDSHPKREIGPLPGHNDRAEYVRWLFFYTGALEPAATARRLRQVRGHRSHHLAATRKDALHHGPDFHRRRHSHRLGGAIFQRLALSRAQALCRLHGAAHVAPGLHPRPGKGQRVISHAGESI